MRDFLVPVLTLAWKDVRLEARSREVLTSVVVFGLLVMIVFSFAVTGDRQLVAKVAPGLLWVAFTFAGMLALNRTFLIEQEEGSLEGLLLAPVGRDVVYFGKFLGATVFMLAVEAALLPLFGVLYDFPSFTPGVLLAVFLGTIGFASVGTLFSAMAANARSREVLLPVLFFPIVLPVIIGAVEVTTAAAAGRPWIEWARWAQVLAVFDVVFLVLCPWVFGTVVEE